MSETTVNEWDTERIAEVRRIATDASRLTPASGVWWERAIRSLNAALSPSGVLSLLNALEEARRDAEEARARADSLVAWLSKDLKGHRLCRACNALDGHMTWCEVPKYEADA